MKQLPGIWKSASLVHVGITVYRIAQAVTRNVKVNKVGLNIIQITQICLPCHKL